jgi:hypothetical protein
MHEAQMARMKSRGRLPSPQRRSPIFTRYAQYAKALFLACTVAVLGAPRRANACVQPYYVRTGGGVVSSWWNLELGPFPLIPRNAAFLWTSLAGEQPPTGAFPVAVDTADQSPIMARVVRAVSKPSTDRDPMPGIFIAKMDQLLSPSQGITPLVDTPEPYRYTHTTGAYVDEEAPATPNLLNGRVKSYESCSQNNQTTVVFTIAERVTDDHTPPELLTYAIYVEKSAEAARHATQPFALLIGALNLHVDLESSWMDSTAYIAVSAIDMAGNESVRSEPLLVNGNERGCACAIPKRHGHQAPGPGAAMLPALAMLAWVRRRARRR